MKEIWKNIFNLSFIFFINLFIFYIFKIILALSFIDFFIIYIFFFSKKIRLKLFLWWIFWWILLIFYTYFFQQDFFERTILRWGSTAMHFEKTLDWIYQVKENSLWLWIWQAWPVSMRFSEDWKWNIAENWFVQMFQEFWVLWWIIYLLFIWSFLIFLIKNFWDSRLRENDSVGQNFALFWGFLWLSGILFAGFFLHSFEDIWVSLILFLFLWVWLFDINKKNI